MKNPLFPDQRLRRITDLSPVSLLEQGFLGVVLDVDNTLTTHDNPQPAAGVLDWIALAKQIGLRLIILSNNHPQRVKPFANALGLDFESEGKKPLPGGFLRACARLGSPPAQTVAFGDQIFTDVIGARTAGLFCILVDPIEPEAGWFFRLKRRLEKPILRAFERRWQEDG